MPGAHARSSIGIRSADYPALGFEEGSLKKLRGAQQASSKLIGVPTRPCGSDAGPDGMVEAHIREDAVSSPSEELQTSPPTTRCLLLRTVLFSPPKLRSRSSSCFGQVMSLETPSVSRMMSLGTCYLSKAFGKET